MRFVTRIELVSLVCKDVRSEPIMGPSDQAYDGDRGDFLCRGFWESGVTAFFDNRIVNADAPSYVAKGQTWKQTADNAANEKKKHYTDMAEAVKGSFTPLVCSVDGALQRDFEMFLKRLGVLLANKWGKHKGEVMYWLRKKVQFAIIRAVNLRVRGTRKDIGGKLFHDDGAGMRYMPNGCAKTSKINE